MTAPPVQVYAVHVKVYRDALRDAVELPITTRGVLYVLAQWMNTDGTNAYPRLERLAASCQLRQRALAKHLSAAIEAGYLYRTSGGHKGRTAVYRAVIPRYRWDGDAERLIQPNPVEEPLQRVHPDAGYGSKACTEAPQSLHPGTSKPAPGCSPTSLRTTSLLLRRSKEPRSADRAGAASPRARVNEAHFDDQDDPLEWIEEHVDGFLPGEEATTTSMIENGYHPAAILNKIVKDRS